MSGIFENWNDGSGNPAGGIAHGQGFTISWQNGPLVRGEERREPNGAFVADVTRAVIQRIEWYQSGKFACPENAKAIEHLERAVEAMESRRQRREEAGIQGTHAKE